MNNKIDLFSDLTFESTDAKQEESEDNTIDATELAKKKSY